MNRLRVFAHDWAAAPIGFAIVMVLIGRWQLAAIGFAVALLLALDRERAFRKMVLERTEDIKRTLKEGQHG